MSWLVLSVALLGQTKNDLEVIEAGRAIGVGTVMTGTLHPTLQALAQEQANYCAAVQKQGHQLWQRQFQDHYRLFPGIRSVVCESWPWQRDIKQAAPECFISWRHSPGHWQHCNGSCRYYGYAIAQGKNGIWYGCGVFSD